MKFETGLTWQVEKGQHLELKKKIVKYTLILKILSNIFRTSFIDPGIIPRATHQEAQDIEHQMEAQNGGANGDANGLA